MALNRFFGSTFLIMGTAIGAGMLALPVSTGIYGIFPSLGLLIICWLILMFTGLLIVEINLWLPPDSHIISMSRQTLGLIGQVVAWITYLLLLYALIAAYLTGMGDVVKDTFNNLFHLNIDRWITDMVLILLVGGILYLGTGPVDYLNRFFLAGKIIAYIVLVVLMCLHVQPSLLLGPNSEHFHKAWLAFPIVVASFGFHTVIPGLRVYLNNDAKKLRWAVIIGSTVPFIVYVIWEIVTLGIIPVSGPQSLQSVLAGGQPATGLATALSSLLANQNIALLFKFFAFFAIATSFIGVSFSLYDFLLDGFRLKKTPAGKITSLVLTYAPPIIFALAYPHGFIIALSYAGIFTAILLALLPAMMAWSGRYWLKISHGYQVTGGKPLLLIAILFSLIVIAAQLA